MKSERETMTRKPTTLHEHFRADPRGADSFGNWIEDRIWELLQRPCELESNVVGRWIVVGYNKSTARALVELAKSHNEFLGSLRVVLLDGTIVKEWLPETKDSANVAET
jgi:hypothetical protein